MNRISFAMVGMTLAVAPLSAQAKTPKACAIAIEANASAITDPLPVKCEQDGRVGVYFCNEDTVNDHTMTVKMMMKDPSGILVKVLAKDISKKVKATQCDFEQGRVLPAAAKVHYKYTIMSDALVRDPDLDVAEPSGLPADPKGRGAAPARGAAAAGRRGRQ